jgi:hypothetical protein
VATESLTPDAHADLRLAVVIPKITRDAKRLAVNAAEELGDLDAKRRAAPRAVAKRPIDVLGTAAAFGHERSLSIRA